MKRFFTTILPLAIIGVCSVIAFSPQSASAEEATGKKAASLPEIPEGFEIATFSAGCYWCVEAVFQRVDGVKTVTSGFTGGHVKNPKYENVVNETTGHAEAVRVVFNPEKVSYEMLLMILLSLIAKAQILERIIVQVFSTTTMPRSNWPQSLKIKPKLISLDLSLLKSPKLKNSTQPKFPTKTTTASMVALTATAA